MVKKKVKNVVVREKKIVEEKPVDVVQPISGENVGSDSAEIT